VGNNTSVNGSKEFSFMLFVIGMSPKSVNAIENLNHLCKNYLKDNFEIRIIDINHNPELAVAHQIIAIPTLIKLHPTPCRTILGDLSNTAKILQLLEIPEV